MKSNRFLWAAMAAFCLGSFNSCTDDDDNTVTDPMNLGTTGKIYVVGHKMPDTDAITSAMAYAELLKSLGYDCEARAAGSLNKETTFALDTFGISAPSVLANAAKCNIILVDHSEYAQSVDGMKDANIVRIVDNHKPGTITAAGVAASYDTTTAVGATCTIVYNAYKKLNISISKKAAQLMLVGILSDTGRLKPTKTSDNDSIAVYNLLSIAGVEDLDAFYTRMHYFADNYDGMTDAEILVSDYKGYEYNGYAYGVANVDVDLDEYLPEMRNRMSVVMNSYVKENNLDFVICKIDADTLDCSNVIYAGEIGEKVATKAFVNMGLEGITSEQKDGYIYIAPHVSRKTVVVPQINKALDAIKEEK